MYQVGDSRVLIMTAQIPFQRNAGEAAPPEALSPVCNFISVLCVYETNNMHDLNFCDIGTDLSLVHMLCGLFFRNK